MRAVGVDISKKEYAALCLVVDGEPKSAPVWKANPKDSEPVQILKFFTWVIFKLRMMRPDVVAVEELAVFMNKKTIRALARREGVALLAAKFVAPIVISPSIGSSRAKVLGCSVNTSKEEAWTLVRKKYQGFDFKPSNRGGMDQADALVHAVAAPKHLEAN